MVSYLLFVTVPAFTKTQKDEFNLLAEKTFSTSIKLYSDTVETYVKGYMNLFPTHLEDDVTRACNYMFLTIYATTLCDMARDKGFLKLPSSDSICDVMVQFK